MILITEDLRDRLIQHLSELEQLREIETDLTWGELDEIAELRAAPLFLAPAPATSETFEAVRRELEVGR